MGSVKLALAQAAAVVAAGCLVGLISNATAGRTRRLDWVGGYPPKTVKDCRKEKPVPPPVAPPVAPQAAAGGGASDVPAEGLPDPRFGEPHVEITSAEALRAFLDGALFLDARMTNQYVEGHVRGARSFGAWEAGLDDKIAELPFALEGNLDHAIVIYCNGGDCEDSHAVSQRLRVAGFGRSYVYRDGFPDWLAHGRPVTAGEAP